MALRRFRITVNGHVYEVEAEEIGETGQNVGRSTEVPINAPTPSPAIAPTAPMGVPGATASQTVSAPLPGTVLAIKATEGQRVAAGEVVVILEAMKMENEIISPVTGVVRQIAISKGDSVNVGDVLLHIEA